MCPLNFAHDYNCGGSVIANFKKILYNIERNKKFRN